MLVNYTKLIDFNKKEKSRLIGSKASKLFWPTLRDETTNCKHKQSTDKEGKFETLTV